MKELPEVDGVLGTGSYYDVANAVGQVLSGKRYKRFDDINAAQSEDGRILTTPEYYAYLENRGGLRQSLRVLRHSKLRGKLRSRPMEELVKEAEQLASDGVKGEVGGAAGDPPPPAPLSTASGSLRSCCAGSAKSTGWFGFGYIISIPMKCRKN